MYICYLLNSLKPVNYMIITITNESIKIETNFFFFQRIVQSQLFDSITENFSSGIDDEQKLLEQRLLEQQRQSEEDSRWLAREEVRY